ncbi:hypothetical protein BVRB_021830, partial [Beta vulgaris subsp. vulgaris]
CEWDELGFGGEVTQGGIIDMSAVGSALIFDTPYGAVIYGPRDFERACDNPILTEIRDDFWKWNGDKSDPSVEEVLSIAVSAEQALSSSNLREPCSNALRRCLKSVLSGDTLTLIIDWRFCIRTNVLLKLVTILQLTHLLKFLLDYVPLD